MVCVTLRSKAPAAATASQCPAVDSILPSVRFAVANPTIALLLLLPLLLPLPPPPPPPPPLLTTVDAARPSESTVNVRDSDDADMPPGEDTDAEDAEDGDDGSDDDDDDDDDDEEEEEEAADEAAMVEVVVMIGAMALPKRLPPLWYP